MKKAGILISISSVFILCLVVSVSRHAYGRSAAVEPSTTTRQVTSGGFEFDSAAAPGWRQGPSNATSIAVFDNQHDCDVMVDRIAGPVDPEAATAAHLSQMTNGGLIPLETAKVAQQFQLTSHSVTYELQQLQVSGSAAVSPYVAQEIGFIPLSNAHLRVQGYCANSADLDQTRVPLQALTFRD